MVSEIRRDCIVSRLDHCNLLREIAAARIFRPASWNRVCSSWNFSARGRVVAYGKIDIQMRASTQAQVDGGGREFQISKITKNLIETLFQNIAVQIVQGGAVKDELSLARAPVRWSAALSPISGFVLNKNESHSPRFTRTVTSKSKHGDF